MNRSILGVLVGLGLVCCARSVLSQTVTVTIAGVVVDQDRVRLGDIRVRLFGGSELRTDLSRGNGVYNLTVSGIDDQTRKLLVRYTDQAYDEAAIQVDLDDAMDDIRRCKAQDLELHSRNPLATSRKEAAARLANAIRTENAKVDFGLTNAAAAKQSLTTKYAEILAALPEGDRKNWGPLINLTWQVEPFVKSPVSPQELQVLPQTGGFQEKILAEQKRLDETRLEIPRLFDEARLAPEKLDQLMSIPSTNIPIEWILGPQIKARLPAILQDYQKGLKKDIFEMPPAGTSVDVAKLTAGNDLKKCLLLYEGLKLNPALQPEQKERIEARIRQLVPLVDSPK